MKTSKLLAAVTAVSLIFTSMNASAATLSQWATSVIDVTSQWSSGSWSANQTLGEPNTTGYGDITTSWCPKQKNGNNLEYITLGYDIPVYSFGALVRETWGNGFVYQIDAIDTMNTYHTVWTGIDDSLPGTPVDFMPTWDTTDFLTTGLKIYVDKNHNLGTWEEIDAVQLNGYTTPVPEPTSMALGLMSLAGFLGIKRRK